MINGQGRLEWTQTVCPAPAQPPCCTHHGPLRRVKHTINYPERKGAMRPRPKAARRASLATFSECSTLSGSHCQPAPPSGTSSLGFSLPYPQGHPSTWVLPPKAPDLSAVPEGIAFFSQGPQLVLPRQVGPGRKGTQHSHLCHLHSMSPLPMNSTQDVSLASPGPHCQL